jgi:hypothetical protein
LKVELPTSDDQAGNAKVIIVAHAAPVHRQGKHMGNSSEPIIIAFSFAIYFLPAIVAWCRGHRNEYAIGILNMLLGWTFIGWVIALVWAYTANTRSQVQGG